MSWSIIFNSYSMWLYGCWNSFASWICRCRTDKNVSTVSKESSLYTVCDEKLACWCARETDENIHPKLRGEYNKALSTFFILSLFHIIELHSLLSLNRSDLPFCSLLLICLLLKHPSSLIIISSLFQLLLLFFQNLCS